MEARDYQSIRVDAEGGVATVTLNQPDRKNPIGPSTVNELLWVLDDAAEDEAIRVVVLTGAGNAFSAGGDLKQLGADGPSLPPKGDFADLLLRFTTLGKPTLARVPGPALGGGLGLVAACDLAVACESAVLGTPEIKRGLFPMQIMAVLSRVVPRRRLLPMMLLGERLSAREALEVGLLTHVVPDADLDTTVRSLAEKLGGQSPTAMRIGLDAWHRQADQPLSESLPWLRDRFFEMLGTEDAQEGLRAFFEKRPPRWTGR